MHLLKPRTPIEENAFENGWITVDGFVQESEHRSQLQISRARSTSNPMTFIKQLIQNRNDAYASLRTHIGSIIFNSFKPLSPD